MAVLAAVLATLVVLLLAGVAVAAVLWRRWTLEQRADVLVDGELRDRLLQGLYVERVVVTLRSREAFHGLLCDIDGASLLLREAEALVPGAKAQPVDGELLIPRSDVLYLQRP